MGLAALLLMLALVVGGGLLVLSGGVRNNAPRTVTLIVDGLETQLSTNAATVRDLLANEGIVIAPDDTTTVVQPPLDAALAPQDRVVVDYQRSVSLSVDGLTSFFSTVMDQPQDILNAAEVTLAPADRVLVNGSAVPQDQLDSYPLPANEIVVRRALAVTVEDGDQQIALDTTTAQTVGDAVAEAGLVLYLGDRVDPAVEEALIDSLTITVIRALPLSIEVDDTTIETRTQAETVGAALSDAGVVLTGLDYSLPAENARVRADMTVRVVRVTQVLESEDIEVPFGSVYQADPTLEIDQRRVIQAGVPGLDQRQTRVRIEDGVEVLRQDIGTARVTDPTDQIVAYGTQIVVRTLDTPDGPVQYWRRFNMLATSYHPAALGGDNITATGKILTKGIVGIDPGIISYGTRLYVPGYGIGEAADTGGPRSTRYWIDLGYDDENWVSWSRQVDVYLLAPAPPPDQIDYLLP